MGSEGGIKGGNEAEIPLGKDLGVMAALVLSKSQKWDSTRGSGLPRGPQMLGVGSWCRVLPAVGEVS